MTLLSRVQKGATSSGVLSRVLHFLGGRRVQWFLGSRRVQCFLGHRNHQHFLGHRNPQHFLGYRNLQYLLGCTALQHLSIVLSILHNKQINRLFTAVPSIKVKMKILFFIRTAFRVSFDQLNQPKDFGYDYKRYLNKYFMVANITR